MVWDVLATRALAKHDSVWEPGDTLHRHRRHNQPNRLTNRTFKIESNRGTKQMEGRDRIRGPWFIVNPAQGSRQFPGREQLR